MAENVARYFARGASQYNQLATVQQQVTRQLLKLVACKVDAANAIVDLGCGTGQLLVDCRQRNPNALLVGVDLASSMLEQVPASVNRIRTLRENLEATTLPDAGFNLVLSSSAMQWSNLQRAMQEASRLVSSGGQVAIACFLAGTLMSWRALWGGQHQKLPTEHELIAAASQAGMRVVYQQCQRMNQSFHSFEAALSSVRGIGAGANSRSSDGLMGRSRLASIKQSFATQATDIGGFSMEYEVLFLIAEPSQVD